MFAVRNIRLCSKDCLCLYVCPTHASDTENGQIDWKKCIGCGACAKACPSGAISMVPSEMPAQQVKTKNVVDSLNDIFASKAQQEKIAKNMAEDAKDDLSKSLWQAVKLSNHIMAEDIARESGFMLPQSDNAVDFLKQLLAQKNDSDFPKDAVEKLLIQLQAKK